MNVGKRGWLYLKAAVGCMLLVLFLAWPLSGPFHDCYSRCVFDRNGILLQATLASDGQFRLPPSTTGLPEKYVKALLTWEDRRFFLHPGVDPASIVAAFVSNLHRKTRIRGGSTITMQLVRMAHPNRRTFFRKLLESCTAIRYSLHLSKDRQLRLYAAHAPMGGNVVGIESASWRYFGASPDKLTWAQAALFAVLPNAPSAINIEKQRTALVEKRNRLLVLLQQRGCFDSLTLAAACAEPLPEAGSRIPFTAPHFCRYAFGRSGKTNVATTLDHALQEHAEAVVRPFQVQLAHKGIRNCAVLMAETGTGAIRAYIGSQSFFDTATSGQVDGVQANRSPGSLLKPFLAACALDRGMITMESILHDVPTYFGNFAPMNASRDFSGVVTVRQMLMQSLNVPAVRLLYTYSVEDFYSFLKNKVGMDNLFRTSGGYGLTLVLGGIETSLWELCSMFGALATYGNAGGLHFERDDTIPVNRPLLSAGAAWLTFNVLCDVKRPEAEYYRQFFSEQLPAAWKTGTSYGQKDAWAIGCNAQWIIGVWAGNFDGKGNALIGGAQTAGPILFSLFRSFTDRKQPADIKKPEYDLKPIEVCAQSGYLPNGDCPVRDTVLLPANAVVTKQCPLHRRFCISRRKGYECCSRCWNLDDTVWRVKTVYDPAVVAVLRRRGKALDTIPRHNPACPAVHVSSTIAIEYPTDGLILQVPRNYSGAFEKVVLKAGCGRRDGRLFWFANKQYLGETVGEHTLAVDLEQGNYRLTVQDEEGDAASVGFRVFKRGDLTPLSPLRPARGK